MLYKRVENISTSYPIFLYELDSKLSSLIMPKPLFLFQWVTYITAPLSYFIFIYKEPLIQPSALHWKKRIKTEDKWVEKEGLSMYKRVYSIPMFI